MNEEITEFVIRRIKAPPQAKPVLGRVAGDPPKEIDPGWIAITHATAFDRESYNITFLTWQGQCLDWIQCETMAIAMDQAKAICGIDFDAWSPWKVEIVNEDGSISWDEVTEKGPTTN
jgi:hypothetical protein